MLTTSAFAEIGSLVGEPTRASMMVALMDGRALTATELSAIAGVTPQTASSHLAQLVAAGLLAVERQGRHRYHRLATPAIARMVEGMMAVAAESKAARRPVRTGPKDLEMRRARTCYDHLAGRVAVAIADTLVARGEIDLSVDGGALTERGKAFFDAMGLDVNASLPQGRGQRVFCRPCLDWSERRVHIAGVVGASLLCHMTDRDWLRRNEGSRVIAITPAGRRKLGTLFDLDRSLWE